MEGPPFAGGPLPRQVPLPRLVANTAVFPLFSTSGFAYPPIAPALRAGHSLSS